MARLKVGGVGEVPGYPGGTREAQRRLGRFVTERLDRYATARNEPIPYATTELSAHLHFGHISPLTIALAGPGQRRSAGEHRLLARGADRPPRAGDQLRRPQSRLRPPRRLSRVGAERRWRLTRSDRRPVLYSASQLEAGETHDPLWNAAQKEMVLTGECTTICGCTGPRRSSNGRRNAETAFQIAIDLNDRYEMDGRDPNGYTGVAWAIGGKHDRPWPERPIFGTIRFMSYESTRKKFDSAEYIAWVNEIARR